MMGFEVVYLPFLPHLLTLRYPGLFSVTVYQALFIAPCSHIFHFKSVPSNAKLGGINRR